VTSLKAFWQKIEKGLDWMPNWGISLGLFVLFAVIALIVHSVGYRILKRITKNAGLFWRSFVSRTHNFVRAALLVLSVGIAATAAPLTEAQTVGFGRAVQVAIIILVGWTALVALDIATIVYLRQFKLDTEDNLLARKHVTQIRILKRAAGVLIGIVTFAAALMTFNSVRQFGVSLLASAGAASLILGLALQPILGNLVAGIQLAINQPIRIDDAVIVEGEWGWIEEIASTYVVIRLWDWRRLIVPLKWFIENPFQNWTRQNASLIGTVLIHVDYTVPVEALRAKLNEIAAASPRWDKQVVNMQVTDMTDRTVEIRMLVSAKNAPTTWDLRCEVREKMLRFLQENYPNALPRQRAEIAGWTGKAPDQPREKLASAAQ
jgi:small-conductance mechanosensitive channel